MATPLTYLKVQAKNGTVNLPIYSLTDMPNAPYRIMTNKGIGCFDLIAPSINTPFRVVTKSGIKGINLTTNLIQNMINSDTMLVMDSGTTMLANNTDFYHVKTSWAGTGLITTITGLKPNTNYKITANVEILKTVNSKIRFGLWNSTKNMYINDDIARSTITTNVKQTITGNINTGNISLTDILELELVNEYNAVTEDEVIFKLYKSGFTFQEV